MKLNSLCESALLADQVPSHACSDIFDMILNIAVCAVLDSLMNKPPMDQVSPKLGRNESVVSANLGDSKIQFRTPFPSHLRSCFRPLVYH